MSAALAATVYHLYCGITQKTVTLTEQQGTIGDTTEYTPPLSSLNTLRAKHLSIALCIQSATRSRVFEAL